MAVAAKPEITEPHSNWSKWSYILAWISDDYFRSLLLPQQRLNRPAVNAIQWRHYTQKWEILAGLSFDIQQIEWSWKISAIFIANSKIALVF